MVKNNRCSDKIDWFGRPVRLNFEGRTHISSGPGVIVSILSILMVISYTGIKLSAVYSGKIQRLSHHNVQKNSEIDLANFQVAFALRNRHKNEYFDIDEDMWGWMPSLLTKTRNGAETWRQIKVKKCGKADWDKFPPASETDKVQITQLKNSKVMYCLDDLDAGNRTWRDEKLYGSFEQPHKSLKLSAFYCIPKGISTVKPFY